MAPSPWTTREPTLDEPFDPTPATGRPPADAPAPPEEPPTPAASGAAPDADPNPGSTWSTSGTGSESDAESEAPGLFDQVRSTRDSAKRLVGAHVELAKAEFEDISDAIKRAILFGAIAIGAALVAALLLIVGMPLYLGDWLFGSMGWGILLGILLCAAIAVALVLLALRPGVSASIGGPFVLAVVLAVVVGVALGANLTNRGWTALGDSVAPGVDPSYRPLLVAVVALGAIGALLGLIAGLRGGGMLAGGGLVGGLVAGVLLGFLTAFAPGWRVGAAIGVTAGLIAWMAFMGDGVRRSGFDTDALKKRYMPQRTIDVTKETIEWARERMPLSRRS
jgi:MFS family permease